MDPLSLLGRAVVVFLLLGLTLWLLRRSDGLKKLRRTETPLEVLGSARLGKGASVALVRIGDADYALGVTDQAVSLLTEAELESEDGETVAAARPELARPSFPAALQAQLGLLTRRGHGSRLGGQEETPASPAATPGAPEPRDLDDGVAAAPAREQAPGAEAVAATAGGDLDPFAELLAATAESALARTDRRTGARAARVGRGAAAARPAGTGQRRASRTRGGGPEGPSSARDAA